MAAGIKLVPLLFIPYLLRRRQDPAGRDRRPATFAVTVGIGFIVLPGPSTSYWLSGYFVGPAGPAASTRW